MLILSHRGFQAHAPENTLAAFEAAITLGVDGIEILKVEGVQRPHPKDEPS